MPFTLTMPKLSPTMEEGTIAKWHKKVGDFIEVGDLVLEASTDKATVEYNAIDSGYLRKILIHDGGAAVINQPIAILTEDKKESIEGYKPEGEAPKAVHIQAEIPKKENASKQQKQPTTQVAGQMSKAEFAPEAPLEMIDYQRAKEPTSRIFATPLARKLAKEKGLDLTTVKGTGPGNRITSSDLKMAEPTGLVAFNRLERPKEAPGSFIEEPLTPMRKVISERLQDAKTFIPHFYVSVKIDAGPLIDLREQLKLQGVKVTYNDLIVRASGLSLRQHPNVNSGFNSINNTIVRFKTIDISVAVSLPTGLITPIIRYADFKNVGEISLEIKELAARAKEGKLASEEYKGGSFTISNLGMYGVSEFIAIINPPQAAILAVGGILQTAVVKDNKVIPGNEMTLTLSGDHRVIDGVSGAEFLKTLQKLLENPAVLLI